MNRTDQAYIRGLEAGDAAVCRRFFYVELAPLLGAVRARLFACRVDYDELVNELYLHLSRNDWKPLAGFRGDDNCRLRTWLVPVAWRYFAAAADRLDAKSHPEETAAEAAHDEYGRIQAAIDVHAVLEAMPSRRYADTLRLLLIEGHTPEEAAATLGTTTANVYNLKCRAIKQFLEIYSE